MAALVTPAASLVSELMVQGRQSAAVLEALLQDAPPTEHAGIRELAAEILRCCDRALAALHHGGVADGGDSGRKRKSGAAAQTRRDKRARASGGEAAAAAKRVEKKRTAEDGFIWRKYGQKEILNSKHPRLYFRCTYKDDSGCPATRQVQMAEDDPSLFVITYFGHHTCCADVAAAAASEEVNDHGETLPFVINFGSSSSSDDYCGGQSETSRSSSRDGCLMERENGEEEELPAKVAKVEAASPDLQPAADPFSSGDASPSSLPWDWDIFNEASFDDVSDFFPF
ncbi:transcription factor WRKY45-2-like [Lolium rigidum]|uniref:transcription factor WRKY45-2-like n=1 Tax=Lolium rigidum TaxID=89674 RepID=UPI001F5C579B|nr:transcription factor WRKY45-2-like [Lolium rigidum]